MGLTTWVEWLNRRTAIDVVQNSQKYHIWWPNIGHKIPLIKQLTIRWSSERAWTLGSRIINSMFFFKNLISRNHKMACDINLLCSSQWCLTCEISQLSQNSYRVQHYYLKIASYQMNFGFWRYDCGNIWRFIKLE